MTEPDGNPKARMALFQKREIRRTLHNAEWWFVITDIIVALTDSADPSENWKKMRKRDPDLGKALQGGGTMCPPPCVGIRYGGRAAETPVLEHRGHIHFIAEDLLWAFLKATQADTLKKLEEDYSTDARDEVFKALRKELERKPVWMILRDGLEVKKSVRLLLYYPKPRSAASAGAAGYAQNRITFRPHFYFGAAAPGQAPKEIDFVLFLNGLPIVDLELKHEANQNVHDAVKQFADRDHQHKIFSHPFLYLAADTSVPQTDRTRRRSAGARSGGTACQGHPRARPQPVVRRVHRHALQGHP